MWDDGNSLGPKEVHNYLNRVMYNRRNKFNPLWNSLVLGGVKNGQKYLGTVTPFLDTYIFLNQAIIDFFSVPDHYFFYTGEHDWSAF